MTYRFTFFQLLCRDRTRDTLNKYVTHPSIPGMMNSFFKKILSFSLKKNRKRDWDETSYARLFHIFGFLSIAIKNIDFMNKNMKHINLIACCN